MKIALQLVAVFTLFIFLGCASDPIKTEKTDNPDVKVSLLFVHDGCKMYRFNDGGQWIYFVKCDGSVDAQTIVPEHLQGKITIPQRMVQTQK